MYFDSGTITERGIRQLSEKKLTYLQLLTITNCYELTNVSMKSLVKAQLPNLVFLGLQLTATTVDGVKLILKHCFLKLTTLSLDIF